MDSTGSLSSRTVVVRRGVSNVQFGGRLEGNEGLRRMRSSGCGRDVGVSKRLPVECAYSVPERGAKDGHRRRSKALRPPRLATRDLDFGEFAESGWPAGLFEKWAELREWAGGFFHSKYDKQIFGLAGPALLTLAADPLLSIVDTAFVGRLGSNELASLGVNTALFSLAFVVFNFLAATTTPLIASALSSGDKEKASEVTIQVLLLSGVLGVSLLGGLLGFADPLLHWMGADGEVANLGKDYLVARSLAAPAVMVGLAGQGIFRGLQDMKTPLMVTLLANGVNLVLDPILIYGLHMGVEGAALSTSTAEWGSAIAYMFILWRQHRETLGLNCSMQTMLERAQANYLPFITAGGTVLLRTSVLLGTKTLASSVATHLGSVSIASHQVVAQLWLLHSLMTDSFAVSGQSLVAVALSSKDRTMARGISDRLLQLGGGLGLGMAAFYVCIAPFIPSAFTDDPQVTATTFAILPIAIGVLPLNSLAYVFDGIMIGAADFEFLAYSMASAAVLVSSCLSLVEPLNWGLQGVWWCQSLLMMMRLSTLAYRYNSSDGPIPPIVDAQWKYVPNELEDVEES